MKLLISQLFIISVLFFACGLNNNTKKVSDEKQSFTLEVPQNWEVLENKFKINDIHLAAPLKEGDTTYREDLIVRSDKAQRIAFQEFFEGEIKGLIKLKDADIHMEGTAKLKNGEASWVHYSYDYRGKSLSGINFYLEGPEKIYTIMMTTDKAAFEEHKPTFEDMAASFELKGVQ